MPKRQTISRTDVRKKFLAAVQNLEQTELSRITGDVTKGEDDEEIIGKMKLLYAPTETGYITFIVMFYEEQYFKVLCIDTSEVDNM